jgi:hypothetical protein
MTTLKGGGVSKPLATVTIDDKLQKPISVADTVANDRLRPWNDQLAAGEERTITYREWIEGDLSPNNELDAPARLRIEMRAIGPHVYDGAPVDAHFAGDPKLRSRFGLSMGNPHTTLPARPTLEGVANLHSAFSKEEAAPTVEFKYDNDIPPQASRTNLTDSLAELEFLRDSLVRDFAAALSDPKDDKKNAAGWDAAMDSAMAAIRSSDPVVQGFGVRALAWLGSGLSTNMLTVHAEKDKDAEGLVVPDNVAKEAAKAAAAYSDATGGKYAPAPFGARSVRALMPKLGEPAAHRKDGENALKRLSKRIDDKKIPNVTFAAFFGTQPPPAVLPAPAPVTAKVIVFGPRGPMFDGEKVASNRSLGTPKRPIAARIVHALSNRKHLTGAFIFFGLLGAAAIAFGLLRDDKKPSDEGKAETS